MKRRGGWRTALALALTAILGLQGCSAVASRQVAAGATTTHIEDGSRGLQLSPGAARFLQGQRSGELTQVSCGFGFGLSKGEGAVLIGLLVLAAPFIIVFGVLAAPLWIAGR